MDYLHFISFACACYFFLHKIYYMVHILMSSDIPIMSLFCFCSLSTMSALSSLRPLSLCPLALVLPSTLEAPGPRVPHSCLTLWSPWIPSYCFLCLSSCPSQMPKSFLRLLGFTIHHLFFSVCLLCFLVCLFVFIRISIKDHRLQMSWISVSE